METSGQSTVIDLAEYWRRTTEPFAIDNTGTTNCVKYPKTHVRPIGIGSIEYIISGKGVVTENHRTFQVKAGDVFILHPGNYHHFGPDPDDPWIKIWVQVSGPAVADLFRVYHIGEVNHIPDFDLKEDLFQIREIINRHTDIDTINQHGPHLLLSLVQKIRNELKERGQKKTSIEELIRERIDSIPNGQISLDQLSEEFHFSKRHINRIFQERYRVSLYQYILSRKVAIAQSLLKKTNLQINKIAEHLSFCDAGYFTEFFRKHTGMTPLEFRKKYGDKQTL